MGGDANVFKGAGIPPPGVSKLQWYLQNSATKKEELQEKMKQVINMLHTKRTKHAVSRRKRKYIQAPIDMKKRQTVDSRVTSTLFGKEFRLRSSVSHRSKHLKALWLTIIVQASRIGYTSDVLTEYQKYRDKDEAAILIQRNWRRNKHRRRVLKMGKGAKLLYGWVINVRFIIRLKMSIRYATNSADKIKKFLRRSQEPIHSWAKVVHIYMQKIKVCQRIWKEYKQITLYRMELLSKIWDSYEKQALQAQVLDYHSVAAKNLWDAEELSRIRAFQTQHYLSSQKRKAVTPGVNVDDGKPFQDLRKSLRSANRRNKLSFGSALLETLEDMEKNMPTPAREASKAAFLESQQASSKQICQSPVANLASPKTRIPRWLKNKKVVYAMDPSSNRMIACRYAPQPAPHTIKMAMIRRYLTHRRRNYAAIVRHIRAENIKYILNEKLKLNEYDSKFILTQPTEVSNEAISLHFNATFSLGHAPSPTMLITEDAKKDVLALVKEAFNVATRVKQLRSQELLESFAEQKQSEPLDGPMTVSTWSAKVGSTFHEREFAANAATKALISLYDQRGDKFNRKNMETVTVRVSDRRLSASSIKSVKNQLDSSEISSGRRRSRVLNFGQQFPIPEPTSTNEDDDDDATPPLDDSPPSTQDGSPVETPFGEFPSNVSDSGSTMSSISTHEDHPLWFQETEAAVDRLVTSGSFSSVDDVEIAKHVGDEHFAQVYQSLPKREKEKRISIKERERRRRSLEGFEPLGKHYKPQSRGNRPLSAKSQPSPSIEPESSSHVPIFSLNPSRRASVSEQFALKRRRRSNHGKKHRTRRLYTEKQNNRSVVENEAEFDITDIASPIKNEPVRPVGLANILHPTQRPRTKSGNSMDSFHRRKPFGSPLLGNVGSRILSPSAYS